MPYLAHWISQKQWLCWSRCKKSCKLWRDRPAGDVTRFWGHPIRFSYPKWSRESKNKVRPLKLKKTTLTWLWFPTEESPKARWHLQPIWTNMCVFVGRGRTRGQFLEEDRDEEMEWEGKIIDSVDMTNTVGLWNVRDDNDETLPLPTAKDLKSSVANWVKPLTN